MTDNPRNSYDNYWKHMESAVSGRERIQFAGVDFMQFPSGDDRVLQCLFEERLQHLLKSLPSSYSPKEIAVTVARSDRIDANSSLDSSARLDMEINNGICGWRRNQMDS